MTYANRRAFTSLREYDYIEEIDSIDVNYIDDRSMLIIAIENSNIKYQKVLYIMVLM